MSTLRFRGRRRRALTLTELMVALAVLAAAAVPILGMLGGARTHLDQSQESLRMQLMACQVFEETRVRVVRGEYAELAGPEEATLARQQDDLKATVSVVRDEATWGFEVVVAVESSSRRFAFRASVADASTSFSGLPRPEAFGLDTTDPLWNGGLS